MLTRETSCFLHDISCLSELNVVLLGVEVEMQVACNDLALRFDVLKQAEHRLVVGVVPLVLEHLTQVVQVDILCVQKPHLRATKSYCDAIVLEKPRPLVVDELKAKTLELRPVEVSYFVHLLQAKNTCL